MTLYQYIDLILSMPVLSKNISPEMQSFDVDQEVMYAGGRAYIVMEVARRINDERTYKIRKGHAILTVPLSQLSPAKHRNSYAPHWPPTEVSAPKARLAHRIRQGFGG